MSKSNPSMQVAVVMRKVRIDGPMARWQPWRWELAEVLDPSLGESGEARLLLRDENEERWLYPGFTVELFRDDAEGYYLNATTEAPAWFVMWRMEEEPTVADEPLARPHAVSVSYNDAGRWMEAQENVEQLPAPPHVIEWVRSFADAHYVPEPRRRKRPESFKPLSDRFGNPASVSGLKKFGPSHE